MGAHIDDAEPAIDKPLISFSIGSSAVFLIGSTRRDIVPTPIFLQSGDILIQEGPSRRCFHSIPRIIEGSSPRKAFEAAAGNLIATYNRLLDDTSTFGERVRKAIQTSNTEFTMARRPGSLTTKDTTTPFVEPNWCNLDEDITLLMEEIAPYLQKYELELPDVVDMLVFILDYLRINFNVRQVVNPNDVPPSQIREIRAIDHVKPQKSPVVDT
uniref:Alpha-ketoglutarate-dependent dioxygenase alkB n=1 Tax=Lygus hesperus TaxID=30085 RepID=A0A0A9ZC30_LYGHE